MPTLKLTQTAVDALLPTDKFVTYWDLDLHGFGVRVSPKGKKTLCAHYVVRGTGKKVLDRIDRAEAMAVAQARETAKTIINKAYAGVDTVQERRAKEAKAKQDASKPSFAKLAERYIQHLRSKGRCDS